jgi:peptide/nickel transport system substrate-binding protein
MASAGLSRPDEEKAMYDSGTPDAHRSGPPRLASRRDFLKSVARIGLAVPMGLTLLTATAPIAAAAAPLLAAPATVTLAQAATREKTLVMAASEVAPNLDVEFAVHWGSHYVWDAGLDRFIEWAPKARGDGFFEPDLTTPDPRLAESWDYAPDGTSIVVNLRKGVMSAAGNEMTADDVKYMWDRKFGAGSGEGAFYTSVLNLASPDSVKVLDKYRIQFNASSPTPIFISVQTQGYAGVPDSQEFKKHATADDPWSAKWASNNMAGFGPYYIESLQPNQQIVLARHDRYYRQAPYFDKIIFQQVPASSNRVALLLSGDVDVVPDLLPREIQELKQQTDSGVKVVSWVGNQLTSAVMNVHMPPFDKVEVRQALNYAMPWQDIMDSVYFGLAQQMKSPYASIYPMATQEFWNYDTNLEKAKQLLAQAGYPNGFETELMISTAFPEQEPLAVLMQTAFAPLGVTLNISKLPQAAWYEKASRKQTPFFIQWEQANCPDAGYSLHLYYHSASHQNLSDLQDPKLDALINNITGSIDDTQRAVWAKEAQRILIQDDVPWINIVHAGTHLAMRKDLVGVTWKTTNSFEFSEMSRVTA